MGEPNFLLWLAWALFGSYLVLVCWKWLLPAAFGRGASVPGETRPASPAWLYCEGGAPIDRRAEWFPLRVGGETVVGAVPRKDTPERAYVYLTAEDIRPDHLIVRFNGAAGRYELQVPDGGAVLHNNERVAPGDARLLADGDTLDLGALSRFRFTLTGPGGAP